ncbi:MAG: hypothetical protein HC888_10590 [Candidatus Competibacteraceae bacterium]|nr:hypothetical protein [Candidatus Competibacteraceae bacterium]
MGTKTSARHVTRFANSVSGIFAQEFFGEGNKDLVLATQVGHFALFAHGDAMARIVEDFCQVVETEVDDGERRRLRRW